MLAAAEILDECLEFVLLSFRSGENELQEAIL